MTKRVRRLADSVATRRGFLGKLGWGATAAVAALGGLLASPTVAQAKKGGDKKTKYWCCWYEGGSYFAQVCSSEPCPPSHWGIPLAHSRRVGSCKKCPPFGG
jgi:hypothetical protein